MVGADSRVARGNDNVGGDVGDFEVGAGGTVVQATKAAMSAVSSRTSRPRAVVRFTVRLSVGAAHSGSSRSGAVAQASGGRLCLEAHPQIVTVRIIEPGFSSLVEIKPGGQASQRGRRPIPFQADG